MIDPASTKYINSLRNEAKRHYAVLYLEWLLYQKDNGGDAPEHGRLNVMGAQAVRMRLDSIQSSIA